MFNDRELQKQVGEDSTEKEVKPVEASRGCSSQGVKERGCWGRLWTLTVITANLLLLFNAGGKHKHADSILPLMWSLLCGSEGLTHMSDPANTSPHVPLKTPSINVKETSYTAHLPFKLITFPMSDVMEKHLTHNIISKND